MSGNLLSAVFDPCTITVGSSGALYGLLGAFVPFSIEYWDYLVRPWLTFALVLAVLAVAQLTNLAGFSAIDNYAHLGGCLGGMLVGFATIRSMQSIKNFSLLNRMRRLCCMWPFSRCYSEGTLKALRDENAARLRRELTRQELYVDGPPFSWRVKDSKLEWTVRLLSFVFLCSSVTVLWLYLLVPGFYEKVPTPGRMSFMGFMGCSCCRVPSLREIDSHPVLGAMPAQHSTRLMAGSYWCFSSQHQADFFCGLSLLNAARYRDSSKSVRSAAANRGQKSPQLDTTTPKSIEAVGTKSLRTMGINGDGDVGTDAPEIRKSALRRFIDSLFGD